jgi:hypothetical protein
MVVSRHHVTILAAGILATFLVAARGESDGAAAGDAEFIRDSFEAGRPTWQQEYTDATVRLMAHERTDRAAHDGRLSEHFRFEADSGSRFFVSYALPRVPVTGDLGVSLFVRANRAGAQVFGWVVLPADIDPDTRAPSYVLVPGTMFNRPDRWQKLELGDLIPAIEEQARVLRASTRRPISLQGAYLERVVVNLMGGTGESDVFLDDLAVGPVPAKLAADLKAARSQGTAEEAAARGVMRKAGAAKEAGEGPLPRIRFSRLGFSRLIEAQRRYVPWFPTAIEAPGADPIALRQAGYDVLITGSQPDRKKVQSAVKSGMFLLPRLTIPDDEEGGVQRLVDEMARYPLPQSVALWSIGEHLGRQREVAARKKELERIRDAVSAVHERDDEPSLATATVDGEVNLYSRTNSKLDVIGVDLPIWGTSESFVDGLEYLKQQRNASARSNAEAMFWAWLPAAPSPVVTRNIWGTDAVPPWGTPPVQPDQLRLMTYMALAGGCRGLSFVGDSSLTRPAGEPLLIEMNFLNAEIDLFEQILAQNIQAISEYRVFDPDPAERPSTANVNMKRMPLIKEVGGKPGLYGVAIPMPGAKGCLLLVADFGSTDGFGTISQWQPPQSAYNDLVINPRVPQGVQFLEVSPGDAHFLEMKTDDRVPGGTRITLPDFGLTTMVLCTADVAVCQRVQALVQGIRPRATQMAIRQAELQLALVRETHERLKADGHQLNNKTEIDQRRKRGVEAMPTDADDLVAKVEELIKNARVALEAEDYATAWGEARRAGRPMRNLMAGYWRQAMTELREAVHESFYGKKREFPRGAIRPYPDPPVYVTGVSCPAAISFYTLPQLHIWKDWIKGLEGYQFGANRVPSGSFDRADILADAGWTDISHRYEHVVKKLEVRRREKTPVAPRDEKAQKDSRTADAKHKPEVIKYEDEQIDPNDHVLMLSVTPDDRKIVDEVQPVLDYPAAAVLSPAIPIRSNNLVRISVLVRWPFTSAAGKGGVIIRDTIGGEQFQYRSSDAIPRTSRVVLYRKAPANGSFRVMLGVAGYGEVYFDDFRVQVMEDNRPDRPIDPELVQRPQPGRATPRVPDPRQPPAAAISSASRRQR